MVPRVFGEPAASRYRENQGPRSEQGTAGARMPNNDVAVNIAVNIALTETRLIGSVMVTPH